MATPAFAQHFHVAPFLQLATPTGITITWETHEGGESRVEWGPDMALGAVTDGASAPNADGMLHMARLVDLQPDTAYFYRVRSGEAVSAIARFRTPPLPADERSFRLVAMSDMQIDRGAPEIFGEIVSDGIIAYLAEQVGGELSDALAMALVPGDLVENGLFIGQWRRDFFAPGQPLFNQVPVYAVPGNHEYDSGFFFSYFDLPQNGTPPYEEHWWFTDYSNLRVIGLDTNGRYRLDAQLDWLDGVLAEACADDHIDFVFAQLHHPHLSELWPVGEIDYTGEIIARMEAFSTDCEKPSLHFFGHTHGYARGQSRDHRHLWVNVASAGGNLDRWGEYAQNDYDEFVVSQDEYGFVVVEVDAGDAPEFRLTRVSQGRPGQPMDNVVRDHVRVRRYEDGPAAPEPRFPVAGEATNPDCVDLTARPMADLDDDAHQASRWQLARNCRDFEAPLVDRWRQDRNWFDDEDRQAGDDLIDERIEGLTPLSAYCWRVRYRDDSLAWSDWSEPAAFITGPSQRSENLVRNPGAEDDLAEWVQAQGVSEALPADDCNGVAPGAGDRYFIIGGLCESSAYAELTQLIDLAAHVDAIDADTAVIVFGALMADFNGADEPEMRLRFLDAEGAELAVSETIGRAAPGWQAVRAEAPVPALTRSVEVVLMGTRNAGQDNDSYIDDVFVRVSAAGGACAVAPPIEPPVEGDLGVVEDMGIADMGADDMGADDMGADAMDTVDAAPFAPDAARSDGDDMGQSGDMGEPPTTADMQTDGAAQPGAGADEAGVSDDCSARPGGAPSLPCLMLIGAGLCMLRRRAQRRVA
ncbi:MAG: hypothetical protein ACI9U2_004399 [Bradymonadia bacterium]